ncbi:MAG TPA: histidine phosphatase family protein [Segetibacter sp.]|jgi:phosphohistidine phosphatase
MKNLLIIRHAKSSWDSFTQHDFDRPLNDRGNRDAPMMAKRLLKREVDIDAFVSSPANRALTTATYFAEAYDRKQKHIIQVESLYHAEVNVFYKVIDEFDDDFKTVAIFSHNPGITEFVNSLTNTRIDNMPTCGIFAVKAGIKNWKDFAAAQKDFWFFDYPKLA